MICNVPAGLPCPYCDGSDCWKCSAEGYVSECEHTFAQRHGRRNRKRPRAKKKSNA
jgi:hypothetical protein